MSVELRFVQSNHLQSVVTDELSCVGQDLIIQEASSSPRSALAEDERRSGGG